MPEPNKRALLTALLLGLAPLLGCVAAPPLLDPNRSEFPDSSLVDFGRRGERDIKGFLTVDEAGRFVWPDGSRAKFWGINVAAESIFQPTERIDACVAAFDRAGFNLVRLHHLDDPGRGIVVKGARGLLFDRAKLALLDYWIDQLGRRGIGVYLDLLDYRTFHDDGRARRPGDLGRGAKPYAVFDPALIEQQKIYAKALLRDHVNQYNGRRYADDPTIVLFELFDENGLFIRRRDVPQLLEPYRSELTAQWCGWLRQRYGSTADLRAAWARSGVADPLPAGQRIEDGSLPLPSLELSPDEPPASAAERLTRARRADVARFFAELHRRYYRTMREYLRQELGVRAPLSAVGAQDIVPDLLTVAEELDFIGINYYWDHPIFRAGRDWQLPFFFHYRSPLVDTSRNSFAALVGLARMAGRPLVVREWNHCFPNPHRAAGMVEATAYAALQDLDAMILFTYGARETGQPIGFFDVRGDPARWGLAAALGEIYLTGAIAPARRRVEVAYSGVDTWLFKDYRSELRNLAAVSRVATRCFGAELNATADLTLASGRSGAGRYTGGPLLLSRNDPTIELTGTLDLEPAALFGYPLRLRQSATTRYWFEGGLLFGQGYRARRPGGRFPLTDLDRAGLEAIGFGEADAVGFRDARRRITGFGALTGTEQLRAALDLLRLEHGEAVASADLDAGRLVADTGELIRDGSRGRLTLHAPRVVGVAGNLTGGRFEFGEIRLETATDRGAALLLSLDGRPLSESERFVAKLVGDARTTGLVAEPPAPQRHPLGYWQLDDPGRGPVQTGGRSVAAGWRVYRAGQLWFAVGLAGGVAEIVRDEQGWRWFVDTPGIWVKAAGAEVAAAVGPTGEVTDLGRAEAWQYPAGAAVVLSPVAGAN